MIILRFLRRLCLVIGCIGMAGLVLLPATQIVLREVLNRPFVGLEELTRYLLIVVSFIAVPLVTAEGTQIRMEEALRLVPRAGARLFRATAAAVSAIILAVLVWAIYESLVITIGSSTPTLGIPFWLFNLPAVIGLGVGAVEFALVARRHMAPQDDDAEPR
jgi:TRAP-type C4-dicarboxylate transport system permease small subunit